MDTYHRHSSSLCKRKRNKIPLNLASTKKGSKRCKLKITKEVVNVSVPNNNLAATDPVWPSNDESESYQENVDDTMITSVSAHTKRKQKLAERWNALRSDAYREMIQAHALHPNQNCYVCNSNNANIQCRQCGPLYMCSNCCINIHTKSQYHHFLEIWQVKFIVAFDCFVLYYVSLLHM